jgi:hypothetical protein
MVPLVTTVYAGVGKSSVAGFTHRANARTLAAHQLGLNGRKGALLHLQRQHQRSNYATRHVSRQATTERDHVTTNPLLAVPVDEPTDLVSKPEDDKWITVVGLCAAVAVICSIDRAAISVAILPMADEYGWGESTKGAISR